MGTLIRALSRSGGSLENPNLPLTDANVWSDVFGEGSVSAAGVAVTHSAALRISAVFRGVNLISTTVGKLPLFVQQRTGDANDKQRDTDHPAYSLCRRKPNPYHSALTFRQTLTAHAILSGNGYAYIDRDGAGRPVALLPLLPDRTYPIRVAGELSYVTDTNGSQTLLPAVDVIHIRGLGFDGLTGYSVFRLASDDFGLSIAQTKFAGKFFSNAATPRVLIEVPGELSDTAYKRLQDSWTRMQQGLENAHKTAILEQAAKATPLSISAKDSQLQESRKFDLVSIANWLGLPVHKIGGEGRTAYASLEQENQSFLDEAIDPWLCAWETELFDKLLTERQKSEDSHEIEFERKALLRTDVSARGEFYQKSVGAPFMTRNEARSRENLSPIDGGDEILTPLNMAAGAEPPEPDAKPPERNAKSPEQAAVRQIAMETARRIVKRMFVAAGRGKEPVDDVVRSSLAPVAELCDPLAGETFAGAVIRETTDRIGTETPIDDIDTEAEHIARCVVSQYFKGADK
jgi:HK97 family phage portal protein